MDREFVSASLIACVLSGCAINPDYVRTRPGIKGNLYRDGEPVSEMTVTYGYTYYEACEPSFLKAKTDMNGRFEIKVERTINLIDILPSDKCEFELRLCFEEEKIWDMLIEGNGEIEFHTGGSVLSQPERLFFQTAEGRCQPPKWLR